MRSCLLLELALVDCHHDGVRLRRWLEEVDWGGTYLELALVDHWSAVWMLALALSLSLIVGSCGL